MKHEYLFLDNTRSRNNIVEDHNLNKIKLSIYYLMMKIWMHLNFDGKLRSKHNEKLKLRNFSYLSKNRNLSKRFIFLS